MSAERLATLKLLCEELQVTVTQVSDSSLAIELEDVETMYRLVERLKRSAQDVKKEN